MNPQILINVEKTMRAILEGVLICPSHNRSKVGSTKQPARVKTLLTSGWSHLSSWWMRQGRRASLHSTRTKAVSRCKRIRSGNCIWLQGTSRRKTQQELASIARWHQKGPLPTPTTWSRPLIDRRIETEVSDSESNLWPQAAITRARTYSWRRFTTDWHKNIIFQTKN